MKLFTTPEQWVEARDKLRTLGTLLSYESRVPLPRMRETHFFGYGYVPIGAFIQLGDWVLWNGDEDWRSVEMTNIYPPGVQIHLSSSPIKRRLPWWQPQA